ncbi:HlyD family secretion protein [Pseudonocardia abyssalis]|uniref:Uncharacterized protein n=1 Tax=Pseudonocardia abyssalis TaxID=2792008 RepID=A0ABS6UYQ7_9PSEU|nr:HlyD family secretion protein [Pseudonocardia abyssalis]MBW0117027.1 hypothetical protein [Pseudonocardia abyssalis]MBW0136859.1 hypothetical protein [Pseudonocardia abyssalis]
MANQVTLTFAGDADQLAKEAKKAEAATKGVGDAALESSKDIGKAAEESKSMGDRMSNLGNTVSGAIDSFDAIAGSVQAFADIQDAGRQSAARMERALIDVEQAQSDLNQAVLDGNQAGIDADQARLDGNQALIDQKVATQDLAAAIGEFGAGSAEALQAQQDLDQARLDGTQATADYEQALTDGNQSLIDARSATLDLADAQHEVDPGPLQGLANTFGTYAPLLSGVVSVIALATAAQWSLNFAFLASPTTWIVAGIVALVGAIIWIATQTTWFQDIWTSAWSGIKGAASSAWDFIKKIPGWLGSTFAGIGNAISGPFKSGFNAIARAWNNSIGRLSWTVPGWVPFIGGNSISVPKLPTFHTGGVVPGAKGSEVMAMLQAGERVIPADRAGSGGGGTITFTGNTDSAFASLFMSLVRTGQIQIN